MLVQCERVLTTKQTASKARLQKRRAVLGHCSIKSEPDVRTASASKVETWLEVLLYGTLSVVLYGARQPVHARRLWLLLVGSGSGRLLGDFHHVPQHVR
jgi:hypothetical protein